MTQDMLIGGFSEECDACNNWARNKEEWPKVRTQIVEFCALVSHTRQGRELLKKNINWRSLLELIVNDIGLCDTYHMKKGVRIHHQVRVKMIQIHVPLEGARPPNGSRMFRTTFMWKLSRCSVREDGVG